MSRNIAAADALDRIVNEGWRAWDFYHTLTHLRGRRPGLIGFACFLIVRRNVGWDGPDLVDPVELVD